MFLLIVKLPYMLYGKKPKNDGQKKISFPTAENNFSRRKRFREILER